MTVRITWKRVVAGLVALFLMGLAAIFTGLVPIAASEGHWRITDWVLHRTMESSVRTQSLLGAPKDPADASGIISAAGHFDAVCADCHGAPGKAPLAIMQSATPSAPDLSRTAGDFSDRELHWIIDHGIKYTGMPAWPARERTDEIRHMTAFVRRLPGMSAAEYARLIQGDGAESLGGCATCHGADGMGRDASVPVLAGQNEAYLVRALTDYRSGRRESAVMGEVAAGLADEQIAQMAARYSKMPGLISLSTGGVTGSGAGAQIALAGLPEKQLPACLSCHAEDRLQSRPRLAGQKAGYIAARLGHMRGQEHKTDVRKSQDTMPTIARRIPKEAIDEIARWWHMADD